MCFFSILYQWTFHKRHMLFKHPYLFSLVHCIMATGLQLQTALRWSGLLSSSVQSVLCSPSRVRNHWRQHVSSSASHGKPFLTIFWSHGFFIQKSGQQLEGWSLVWREEPIDQVVTLGWHFTSTTTSGKNERGKRKKSIRGHWFFFFFFGGQ